MNMREMALDEKIKDLKKSMTNITVTDEKNKRIEEIRKFYKKTGEAIFRNCPESRNLSLAITNLEDSLHRAVKSIVGEGEFF